MEKIGKIRKQKRCLVKSRKTKKFKMVAAKREPSRRSHALFSQQWLYWNVSKKNGLSDGTTGSKGLLNWLNR
jgi:hypothetical protein